MAYAHRLPIDPGEEHVDMRRVTVIALMALLVAGATGAVAGHAKRGDCKIELESLAAPTDREGTKFGTARCTGVLSKGVERVTFKALPTSPTAGTVTGAYKQYYDRGTVHGTFELTFSIAPTGAVTYSGGGTVDGGTGAYRRVRGTVTKLTCSSPDGGVHTSCTARVTLTRR